MKHFLAVVLLTFAISMPARAETTTSEVTILSTMVASYLGAGEWGFAAVIETPETRILFDTGFKPGTVLGNATRLQEDLSDIETVILTHFHTDHTGGLVALRRHYRDINPNALSQVYVGKGFFEQRHNRDGDRAWSLPNPFSDAIYQTPAAFRAAAEAEGIRFTVIDEPTELAPGVFLSGPIPRVHPEKNVSPNFQLMRNGELTLDTIPESQVLGILTAEGWQLVSGCGHAGIVNAATYLQTIRDVPVVMAIGGFHLFRASEETIGWTAYELEKVGLTSLVGAHCTGVDATYRLAELLGLPEQNRSIGAVGTRIDQTLRIRRASIE